mmetsp:Transcript_2719/g.2845  ORF Transcript_2719/g.2845 Transcript_2719/m.2845 type:complete len:148 (+) Transcript_2719:118-561(+)|eukprot:CAMPEP_0119049282 /NCGR_PEP_ID=MMETSP1177-20130426/63887_1 /TAXON_ID=2985 /ORGANISM="Ochromonas sp, Strain CCMP1899" /LENGTH=147 /DNA_ID=CAMNT_0007026331 /DNA_START=118 /DNA_END=561 /DNA_ORIENTATION=-
MFSDLEYTTRDVSGDLDNEDLDDEDLDATVLECMEVDKMRCHILNCIAALCVVQIQMMKKEGLETNDYEVVKRKIFTEAISMIFSAEYDTDDNPIVSSFPDDSKMSDKRTWLPMHFAISLNVENKICEEDVHILHAANPLAMHLLNK